MIRYARMLFLIAVGIYVGHWWANREHAPKEPKAAKASRATPAAAAPAHGEQWLSDFESEQELAKRWKTRGVVASLSEEHVTHGKTSAKVTFNPIEAPSFAMEDYVDERSRRDWRRYDSLHLDLYNPQPAQERIILQLKDKAGRHYKEDIMLSPKSAQHISVRFEDLKELLDLAHVTQVNLFRWNPRKAATFYVDGLYLKPPSKSAAAASREQAEQAPVVKPAAQWQIGWASSLEKIQRDPALFRGSLKAPVTMTMAGGEYESVQLVFIGGAETARVRIGIGPIANAEGSVQFPPDVVEIRRVDYVTTREPYYPVAYVGAWPDPLPLVQEDVEVPAGEAQPVWITIGAPPSLPAGRYSATITVADGLGRTERLPLEITVWDFVLPPTSHLKTAFDFYRGRLEKAYREFVPGGAKWEGRFGELEDLYFQDMLKHRIAPVMQADPMSREFAQRIDYYLRAGLSAFGIGTRGGSNGNNWAKDTAELERQVAWHRLAAQALRSQDLLKQAYVYAYDEPPPGDAHVAQVLELLHWADPELKNLLVMHQAPQPSSHEAWLKDADILCIQIASYNAEHAKAFAAQGKEMWLYISSPSHPFPSLVIDYPSMMYRVLPWLAWKVDAKGLLYWCVNFWNGDPWENPANYTEDQNGNGALYYPGPQGPIPSIRMEVLRDGMEDYEYLHVLRERLEAAQQQGPVDPALVARAQQLLAVDDALVESLRSFSKDPALLQAQRQAIAELIEQVPDTSQSEGSVRHLAR
jgi:hypothetical protein